VSQRIGLEVGADPGPGVLHQLSGVIAHEQGNILSIEIVEEKSPETVTYFEIDMPGDPQSLLQNLRALPVVHRVALVQTMQKIFGKRIIIVGGGAQVGQVALGAIAEADRHNIRGEKISIDTIPIVGEENLANAVRAVPRLPRAVALVLAGALMGGEITTAVREVRAKGVLVVSLNMAGSAPSAADLVVSDPVQAGVMTVMAVAKTARFDIARQRGRVY